jgi:hypothetical protein
MKQNTFNIPEHTFETLRRYVDEGLEPGGFLTAVLENDLFSAFARADAENTDAMKNIVMHIYNNEPAWCNGRKGIVREWCTRIRQERR